MTQQEPPPGRPEPLAGALTEAMGWLRAVALGVRDTARQMMARGKQGAREATEEGWGRFEAKTKHRRRPPGSRQ